jgi:hypothetical protein
MIKKSIVAAFAFALAFTASAATVAEMGGSTLVRQGSRGTSVVAVQKALNACNGSNLATDGIFGKLTAAQFRAFQTAKNIKVDGIVGLQTKTELEKCSAGTVVVDPNKPAPVVMSGTEGYVTDINADSTNRVTTVYESEANKVIGGVRMTARLADQKVESVRVELKNTQLTALAGYTLAPSSNIGQYLTSVSLMDGTTVLATIPAASLSRTTSGASDIWTAQFTGLSKVITKDTIGRLAIAVTANGSIDSNHANQASWDVKFVDVRTSSPNSIYVVNNTTAATFTGVKFGKFSNSGVKVTASLASSNPLAMTKEVSETTATNDIKLLDFTVKADVSDVTLRNVPVTILAVIGAGSTATDQAGVLNNVKLMKGTELVDSLAPTASGTYVFSNITEANGKVAAGSTATYSIVVDAKASKTGATVVYASGTTTLKASLTSTAAGTWSVEDSTQAQVSTRSGSAMGNVITLASKGVSVALATATAGNVVSGTISGSMATRMDYIDVNVSAFGDTIYIADIFTLANATAKDSTNATVTPTSATIAAAPGETITKQASDFVVNSGETKKFRIGISLTGTAAAPTKQVKSMVSAFEVKVGTAGAAVTAQALDTNIFQTSFAAL